MSAAASKRADELMAKGDKCLAKYSFFGSAQSKFEDAAECYADGAKQFVMAKAFADAGRAYEKAADCHKKAKSNYDTASCLSKAGEAYQKAEDWGLCAAAYREAAAVFGAAGKGNMAGNSSKKLAEALEAAGDEALLVEAVEAYGQACDFYEGEGQPRRADGCREKVAYLSATLEAYEDARAAFDAMGRACLQSNLGKFNAKKWFTNAVLCALAMEDSVKAQNALGEYASLDYSFVGTREHMLCEALCAACDQSAEEAVATAAAEYDRIKRLDPWTTKLLLKIRASCDGGGLDEPAAPAIAEEDLPAAPCDDDEDDLPDLT